MTRDKQRLLQLRKYIDTVFPNASNCFGNNFDELNRFDCADMNGGFNDDDDTVDIAIKLIDELRELDNKKDSKICELEFGIEQANNLIPEGYQVAYDGLVDRVKALVEGHRAFAEEMRRLRNENRELENKISEMEN